MVHKRSSERQPAKPEYVVEVCYDDLPRAALIWHAHPEPRPSGDKKAPIGVRAFSLKQEEHARNGPARPLVLTFAGAATLSTSYLVFPRF